MTAPATDAALAACLPAELRARSSTITPIRAGLSGAGVYRVDARGRAYVLKVSSEREPSPQWRAAVDIWRAAAAVEAAPSVLHVDEARRAVVAEWIDDRGFAPWVGNPATRGDAIAAIGKTLRRVHELAIPVRAIERDPRGFLTMLSAQLAAFARPPFVRDALRELLAAPEPPRDRPIALCHNDSNPTNVAFDGERVRLLDWDTSGPNDPSDDLAAVGLFGRFDDAATRQLIAVHVSAPVAAVSARLAYAAGSSASGAERSPFISRASRGTPVRAATRRTHRRGRSPGVYTQMRAGALGPATADGTWARGLALVREGLAARA